MLDLVTFYVMGPDSVPSGEKGNFYVTMKDWPAVNTVNYYLTPQMTLEPYPHSYPTSTVSFMYDPKNPTPTIGGSNLMIPTCGPYDQRSNEIRKDNIIFTSAILEKKMELVGRMSITLVVSSNCTDTDFVVRLSDVYPDGRSMLLSDSIQRMRWRESSTTKVLMLPGQFYKITIDLWPTAYIFNVGHSIRVAITSSNYPRFSVNPNNGLDLNEKGELINALNSIRIDGQSSFLSLPQLVDPIILGKSRIESEKVMAAFRK